MHKKALTVAIAGVFAAPMAAQAVDFSISGHINRALFHTDTDAASRAQVQDNGSSGTRVRFTGSGEMMNGMTAGVNIEYGATGTLSLRYAEIYYGGEFGKITIGEGDAGGDGSVYSDKSGTLGIAQGQDKGGSNLGGYFDSLDGGSVRAERIRYDTPALGPVNAAVSIGNGDDASAGVTISQSMGDTAFGAKIGTIQQKSGSADSDTISASAGMMLASGVTVSGSWGTMENDGGSDPSYFQGTLGYVMGDTSVAASWWQTSDFVNVGSEGTAVGIAVNHNLSKIDAQVYAAVQNYDVQDMMAGLDTDETVTVVGTRIKF